VVGSDVLADAHGASRIQHEQVLGECARLRERTEQFEARVEDLEPENARLRAESRRLKRENRKLRDENRWLRSEVRRFGGRLKPPPRSRSARTTGARASPRLLFGLVHARDRTWSSAHASSP